MLEDGTARDERVGARFLDLGQGRGRKAAVHLQPGGRANLIQRAAQGNDLWQDFGDEFLPRKTGVDRQHQHNVNQRQHGFNRRSGRGRVQRHTRLASQRLDLLNGAMQMRTSFHMHGDVRRARLCKRFDVTLWLLDHQMRIQRKFRGAAAGLHDDRPHRQVRDEAAVHHVHVDPVRARGFASRQVRAEAGEVCGKNGGGNEEIMRHGSDFKDIRRPERSDERSSRSAVEGRVSKASIVLWTCPSTSGVPSAQGSGLVVTAQGSGLVVHRRLKAV